MTEAGDESIDSVAVVRDSGERHASLVGGDAAITEGLPIDVADEPPLPAPGRRRRTRWSVVAVVSVAVVALCSAALVYSSLKRGFPRLPFLPRPYTTADVNAALLTTADLPDYTSHSVADIKPLTGASRLTMCDRGDLRGVLDGAHAYGDLGTISPWGWVHTEAFLTSKPSAVMPAIRRAFGCGTWTVHDGTKLTVQPIDIGTYGDESFAALVQGTSEDPIEVYIAIRKRNLVSVLEIEGDSPAMWAFLDQDINGLATAEAMDVAFKAAARLPAD